MPEISDDKIFEILVNVSNRLAKIEQHQEDAATALVASAIKVQVRQNWITTAVAVIGILEVLRTVFHI